MTQHSDHPMKKRVAIPKPGPASSCFRCYREGTPSADQRRSNGEKLASTEIRFHCANCAHDWLVNLEEARLHGAFLRRINQSRNQDA